MGNIESIGSESATSILWNPCNISQEDWLGADNETSGKHIPCVQRVGFKVMSLPTEQIGGDQEHISKEYFSSKVRRNLRTDEKNRE